MIMKKQKVGIITQIAILFVISILATLMVNLFEMLTPQVIRTTVDSVIGEEPLDLPEACIALIEKIGGTAYLKEHLGIIAAIVLLFAVFGAVFREARRGYRSGHYDRNLTTTSGDVTLHVPRLKGISFETAIIERYRRRESSVEEALIEMYLAGVSVRRVEDITEALWGSKVSAATISELNKKAYVNIEAWRNRPLQGGKYPYVYVDGIYLKRN